MSSVQEVVILLCFLSFNFALAEQNVTEDKIEKPLSEFDSDDSDKLQMKSVVSSLCYLKILFSKTFFYSSGFHKKSFLMRLNNV